MEKKYSSIFFKLLVILELVFFASALLGHVIMGASVVNAAFFLFLLLGLHVLFFRKKRISDKNDELHLMDRKLLSIRWLCVVVLVLMFSYISILLILKYGWLNGDEFVVLYLSSLPIAERFQIAGGSYFHWVSRAGELVCNIGGLHISRWQVYVINPLVLVSIPLVLWKTFGKPFVDIASMKGVLFILFVMSSLMAVDSVGIWKCYTNYAASANYLWPTWVTFVFLCFFNPANWNKQLSSISFCLVAFIVGLLSGWGTECISVILFPVLLTWLIVREKKSLYIPRCVYVGLIGYVWGMMMLFLSTAHAARAAKAAAFRSIQPENMSFMEAYDWVSTLTADKLDMLGHPNVSLQGIPLVLHVYFFEPLAQLLWAESAFYTYLLMSLVAFLLFSKVENKRKILWGALLCVCLAWIMACAYLAQCIPTEMSFMPPAFFILCGCSYLFLKLLEQSRIMSRIMLLILMVIAIINFVPSLLEAYRYKQYEQTQYVRIESAVRRGQTEILLPAPYDSEPINKLRLINTVHITDSENSYTNKHMAEFYGVKSIKLDIKKKIEKNY